jgi:hypothetical protein
MFQVSPLPVQPFQHLFGVPDETLRDMGVLARIAQEGDRMPCRISLRDARPGERALLLNWEHQPASTPYRSSYAIYVIEGADPARLAPGELPPVFLTRPLAVRAFNDNGLLVDADLAVGEAVRKPIERLLHRADTAYLHVHNAAHGCFSARVDRL